MWECHPQRGEGYLSIWLCPGLSLSGAELHGNQNSNRGVPIVAQRIQNPTRNPEVVGSVPGLAQWVKDPACPRAVVSVTEEAQVWRGCGRQR